MVEVKVKKLSKDAKLPKFQHSGDACADIYSIEDFILKPKEWKGIATGIAVELPTGYEMAIKPRSGFALKAGISIVNSPQTSHVNVSNVTNSVGTSIRLLQTLHSKINTISLRLTFSFNRITSHF